MRLTAAMLTPASLATSMIVTRRLRLAGTSESRGLGGVMGKAVGGLYQTHAQSNAFAPGRSILSLWRGASSANDKIFSTSRTKIGPAESSIRHAPALSLLVRLPAFYRFHRQERPGHDHRGTNL